MAHAIPFVSRVPLEEPEAQVQVQHGTWHAAPPDYLASLATATDKGQAASLDLTRAIPNMWSLVVQFHESWRNPNATQHSRIVDMWRRFLAVILLRDRLRLPFEFHWLDPDGDEATSERPETTDPALAAARALLPWNLFEVCKDGRHIGLISLDQQIVGLVIPAMICMPSRQLFDSIPRRLQHHLNYDDLAADADQLQSRSRAQAQHWYGLSSALSLLEQRVQTANIGAESPLRNLSDRLTKFHLALGPDSREAAPIVTDANEARYIGFPQNLVFVRTLLTQSGPPGHQTFLKVASSDPTSQSLRCVFYSEAMQKLWHSNNHNPLLAKNIYYGDITPDSFQNIRSQLWKEQIQLLTVDDLLTQDLVQLSDGFAAHGPALRGFLLPLRPLAFAFLDAPGALRGLTITEEENSVHRVRLRLPIAGGEDTGMDVVVEKTFEHGDTCRAVLMTTMAQWPSFRDPEVRQDLMLTSVGSTQLRPVAGISRSRITKALAQGLLARQASEFSTLVEHALEAEQSARSATLTDTGGDARILLDLGASAEALVCRHLTPQSKVARGVLALATRTLVREPDATKQWIVGIDFGTTNTAIAIRDPDDELHTTSSIGANVMLPLSFGDAEASGPGTFAGDEAAFEFIPALPQLNFPIMTILETRTSVTSDLLTAHARVPYISQYAWQDWVKRMMAQPDDVRFNLKWLAVDSPIRQYVRRFLEQLVSQILVEARARQVAPTSIQWRWTLPRSLPSPLADAFKSDVGDVMTTVTSAASRELRFHTESESLFHYTLHHDRQGFADIMVAFDVGGRSTDIAIFSEKRLLWDGSLNLGGRVLLIDYWSKNFTAIAPLLERQLGTSLQDLNIDNGSGKVRTAILELIVNQTTSEDSFWGQICSDDGEERIYHDTRTRARIALLGLAYYIAHFVLPEALGGKVPAGQTIGFFFGGRGARLFETLCQRERALIDKATIDGWLANAGCEQGLRGLSFSAAPKMEVAIGTTLADRPAMATDPGHRPMTKPRDGGVAIPNAREAFGRFCEDVSKIDGMVELTSAPNDSAMDNWRRAESQAKDRPTGSVALHLRRRQGTSNTSPTSDGAGNSDEIETTDSNQGLDFVLWLRALLEHFDRVTA